MPLVPRVAREPETLVERKDQDRPIERGEMKLRVVGV